MQGLKAVALVSERRGRPEEADLIGDASREEEQGGLRDVRSWRGENERRAELSVQTAEVAVGQLQPVATVMTISPPLSSQRR